MQSVMLLHGENSVLIKEEVAKIIKKYLPDGEQDINFVKFDMGTIPVQTALYEASVSPFMSDYRLIICDNAIFFTGSNSKVNHDLDALVEYLEKPNSDTILIFIVHSNKLDSRKKSTKLLLKLKAIHKYSEFNDSQLMHWINNQFAKYNSTVTDKEVVETLMLLTDKKMDRIEHEIKKLAEYSQQKPVTKQDVMLLVSRSLEDNIFGLLDELLKGNYKVTLDTIADLLTSGEAPPLIIGIIASKLRLLLICRQLLDDGLNFQAITQQLGNTYWTKKAIEQARMIPAPKIAETIMLLLELDRSSKNSSVSNDLLLEKFVIDVIKKIKKPRK